MVLYIGPYRTGCELIEYLNRDSIRSSADISSERSFDKIYREMFIKLIRINAANKIWILKEKLTSTKPRVFKSSET